MSAGEPRRRHTVVELQGVVIFEPIDPDTGKAVMRITGEPDSVMLMWRLLQNETNWQKYAKEMGVLVEPPKGDER